MDPVRPLAKFRHVDLRPIAATLNQLSSQGWAVPMWLTPRETAELLEDPTPDAVDAAFLRLYEADAGCRLNQMGARLLDTDALSRWRSLLAQAVSAYKRGDYLVTIPALLTVLEGFISGESGKRTNVRDLVKARVDAEVAKWPDSFAVVIWRSLGCLIDEIYAFSDFSKSAPSVLNRHWILHGRDACNWTQADCLRLLQAIDTLSVMSRPTVEQALQPDASASAH